MLDWLIGHGLLFLDSQGGGTGGSGDGGDGGDGKKSESGDGDGDGAGGTKDDGGDEPKLELSEQQIGFLTKKGIDVDKIDSDPKLALKAVKVLADSRSEIAQLYSKADKDLRLSKKLSDSKAQKLPKDIVDGDGKVDEQKLGTVQEAAQRSQVMDQALIYAQQQGMNAEEMTELLSIQDPAEMKMRMQMGPQLSPDAIQKQVEAGVEKGVNAALKQLGVLQDMSGGDGNDKQDGIAQVELDSLNPKKLKEFVGERQKHAEEAFPFQKR